MIGMESQSNSRKRMRFSSLLLLILVAGPAGLQAQGGDPEDWFAEAEESANRGRDRKALGLVERVLEADGSDVEALSLGVDLALNVGEYEKAESWSARRLAVQPDDRSSRLLRARVFEQRGKVADLLAVLAPLLAGKEPAPEKAPAVDFEAVAAAARAHASRGRDAEAEKLFDLLVAEAKRIVIRDPRDLMALAEANAWFGGRQGLDNAEKILAREVQPALKEEPEPFLRLAALYRDRKYLPADAEAEYQDLLKVRPNLAEAWFGLHLTYEWWHKGDKSKAALETCLRINPRHAGAHAARAAEALGDMELERAEGILAKVFEVNPEHRDGLGLQAALIHLRDGPAAGVKALERLWAVDAGYARGHLLIAQVLHERRRWPEALEQARAAVARDPKDVAAKDFQAMFDLFLGNEATGLAAVKAANDHDAYGHPWRNNMITVMGELAQRYRDQRSEHFLHKVHEKEDGALSPYLLPWCEDSWKQLSARYGYVPPGVKAADGKILCETFRHHEGFSARTLGFTHLGASGVCFGDVIFQVSPAGLPLGTHSWARTFHHELAHTMTLGLSKGRTPRWLTEGLSTYEEFRKDPTWVRPLDRDLFDAFHSDELFPVLHFDAGFSTPRVIFAYFQGGLVCEWMEQRFGWPKVLAMLRAYGEDRQTPQVLREVLDIEPAAFDAGFREFVAQKLRDVKMTPRWSEKKIEAFEAKLKDAPEDLDALLAVAGSRIAAKVVLDADEFLLRARKVAPDDPRVLFHLGLAASAAKRTDVARENFEAALAKGFRDHDLHLAMAEILQRAGDSAGAEAQLKLAVETFPRVTGKNDPRLVLARFAEGAGKAEESVRWLEDHLALDYENVKIRKQLLSWYRSRNDVPAQRRHLDALILIDPLDAEVHWRLAELCAAAGDTARALVECRAGVAAGGIDADKNKAVLADLHVRWGRLLLAAGGADGAEDALEHADAALTLVPGHAEAQRLREEASGRAPGTGDKK